jgi:cytochrome c biogenesis protein CcdA
MLYKIVADLTILFHLIWIGFLIFGALLAYKRPWLRTLHLTGLIFSVTMQVYGWYCPLTYVEQWLRTQHHPDASYTGSFIAHYAERLVYLRVSPLLVLILTLVICAGTVYIYLVWPRSRRDEP